MSAKERATDLEEQSDLAVHCEVVRLQALLETSRRVHATIELNEVLHCALEIAVKELEAEGAFFVRTGALGNGGMTTYGRVPSGVDAGENAIPLVAPNGELLAKLVVLRPRNPFSVAEQDFLEGLALQAAVAIENARNHERLIAWERVQKDLEAARDIQRSLLPQSIPDIRGYDTSFRVTPCFEVGGDYLDILRGPKGEYLIMVADVAGKGLASALVAASFRAAFRAMAFAGIEDLASLAARMNELHYSEGPEARRRYVTAILLRLDTQLHQAEIVNAGHNPGILIGPTGSCELLEASGTPLGLVPAMQYKAERRLLEPGSRILLYTDGVTEVFQADEEFGLERLTATACEHQQACCGDLLEIVWQRLSDFAGNASATDDMTALIIARTRNGGEGTDT